MLPQTLIGMPARMDPGREIQYLSRHYTDAIRESGGIPLILPLVNDPLALLPVVEKLQGILLPGSANDVDPAAYGAARETACGPVHAGIDRLDFFLLAAALERKIPLLAICYGVQSLNVFMGGSLIQDIPSVIETPINHNDPIGDGRPLHPVQIAEGTVLAGLAGEVEPLVNSTHHQALHRIAEGLEVIARAPDGIVEAVASRDPESWILGVQWHPEKCFAYDRFSRNIFQHFLARCRADEAADERRRS